MKKRQLLIFLLLAISVGGFAQSKIHYQKSDGLLDITPYVAYRADSAEKLTFEQVLKLPYSAFKPNGKAGINLGNTDIPYWFRVDFADSVGVEDLYISMKNDEIMALDGFLIEQNQHLKTWSVGIFFSRDCL